MLPGDRLKQTYDDFRNSVGRTPATWSIWSDWGGPTNASLSNSQLFPTGPLMADLRATGRCPSSSGSRWIQRIWATRQFKYTNITSGLQDTYITQFAQAAKAYRGRVLIRFAHEMDGYWFPWGMGNFDNTPPTFIAAGATCGRSSMTWAPTNVRWVWSPNGCDCAKPTKQPPDVGLDALYPGDKYVDYLGFSAFNWGSYKDRWATMQSLLKPPDAWVRIR